MCAIGEQGVSVREGESGEADGGADFDVIVDANAEEPRSCGRGLRVCSRRIPGEWWIGERQTKLILYSLLILLITGSLRFLLFYNIFATFVRLVLTHALQTTGTLLGACVCM